GYLLLNDHENPWSLHRLLRRLVGERARADLHHWKLRRLLRHAGFRARRTFGIGLWIYRAKLQCPEVLNSHWADALELLSSMPLLRSFCPDAVILAQRSRTALPRSCGPRGDTDAAARRRPRVPPRRPLPA